MKTFRILGVIVGTFLLLGVMLNMFTAVYAANITVNSNLDTADPSPTNGVCDVDAGTPGNQCTLRGAIQTAQGVAGSDTIYFASSMDINLTSSLPTLSEEGLSIIANSGQTVRINGQSSVNNIFRISGSYVTISNVVVYGSGSGYSNIWISDNAFEIVIANNLIGDDDPAPGGCGQSNDSFGGIYVSSTGPIPSDTNRAWIAGNTIECQGEGISVYGTDRVLIGPFMNEQVMADNVIRQNRIGVANLGSDQIYLIGNTIENNLEYGVAVGGGNDLFIVGCLNLSALEESICRNKIRGNGEAGVYAVGSNVGRLVLLYNWIGLADDGVTAVPNNIGVHLHTDNERTLVISNTISGNTEDGIRIQETRGDHLLAGNVIGLGVDGVTAVPNGSHGIAVFDDAGLNEIGAAGEGNTISGNDGFGILVSNSPSNTIQANLIGLTKDATAIRGNGYNGIYVENSDYTNIGSVASEEVYGLQKIVGNGEAGIYLENANDTNISPGTDVTDNDGAGIYVYNSQRNLIYPHLVTRNSGEGVQLSGNSGFHNQIIPLHVWGNGRLPIDFGLPGLEPNDLNDTDNGPNHLLNYPEVTITSGTVVTGTACANCFILAYQVQGDPTANGGGGIYKAFTVSNASGVWSLNLEAAGLNLFPVAFMVISGPVSSSTVDSSPLSPVTQVGYGVFLPMIVR